MVKKRLLLVVLNSLICIVVSAQKFIPPAEGNAVVYIVRTSSFGSALNFRVFHNENFVGIFKGKGYIRYELPAGEQLLWFVSEKKKFLACELKSGGTYIISSTHSLGVVKNNVVINPISSDNSQFESCKNVILKGKEITTSDKKKASIESSLSNSNFIDTTLKQYHEEPKFEKRTKEITPEMAIPLIKLQ
ncbi:hypothetical protein [Carboxylicivirga sp. N1Y90]|uniref:hypothetical protein n=1 Tax=Carboxylicivirga fragile TaxID=3417571 RepID=UPI003D32670B|nr:hypothetical protein [Marinilabiliaceae bacterium N1Y90]